MKIVEFLLARIAEDENAAQHAGSFTPWTEAMRNDNYGHLTIQPTRVLAECAAKRGIVERNAPYDDIQVRRQTRTLAGDTLRQLAAIYADHPDYRQEWKP